MSVSPPVCICPRGSYWKDFPEIWYWVLSWKLCRENAYLFQVGQIWWSLKWRPKYVVFFRRNSVAKRSLFDWNVIRLIRWPRRYERRVNCLFPLTTSVEYCGRIINTPAPNSGGHGSYVRSRTDYPGWDFL